MNEQEMREMPDPWPATKEEFIELLDKLENQEHDYGTCVYAMSLLSIAAKNYIAHKLGVTGFQASCADMDYMRRARDMKNGFMIIDYNNLLYPQYLNSEHFPSIEQLEEEHKEGLAKAAKEKLSINGDFVHPDVRARWEYLASKVPE